VNSVQVEKSIKDATVKALEQFAVVIERIRQAKTIDDLNDLKRLVGPTENEKQAALSRIKRLDQLFNRAMREGWGSDYKLWPYPHGESYARISAENIQYENMYC